MPEIKNEQKVSEDEREHAGLKEKVLRNKAVVALNICGFSQRQIAKVVGSNRRNIQLFIKKYSPRYNKELMENINKFQRSQKAV